MATRILISDPDWRLLAFAFGDLRRHGYDVIVEPSAAEALALARTWRPNVVIASRVVVEEWDRTVGAALADALANTAVLVTVGGDEEEDVWQPLLDRGFDVLPKPLIHPSELRAATESVMRMAGLGQPASGLGGLQGHDEIGRGYAQKGTA